MATWWNILSRKLTERGATALLATTALCGCNSVDIITSGNGSDEPAEEWKRVEVEVLDYSPAPGQFVNVIPEYTPGDTRDDMARKASASLNAGREITLGAWGGNVTLRLPVPLINTPGPDLRVCGNAILSGINDAGIPYGSSEPGIVEVMQDSNGNGLPDDGWLELRGECYDDALSDYFVIYTPDGEDGDIAWIASDGSLGIIPHLDAFHAQPYYPQWVDKETLTFYGKHLPDNGFYNPATGKFDLYGYAGYADSFPDTDERSTLDLDNAVDASGNTAVPAQIDFIRITTGVLQVNGPLGECSTEISGIEIPVF